MADPAHDNATTIKTLDMTQSPSSVTALPAFRFNHEDNMEILRCPLLSSSERSQDEPDKATYAIWDYLFWKDNLPMAQLEQ